MLVYELERSVHILIQCKQFQFNNALISPTCKCELNVSLEQHNFETDKLTTAQCVKIVQ